MRANEIKIDKGVPVPPLGKAGRSSGVVTAAIHSMEVGDSVFGPRWLAARASKIGSLLGRNFLSRSVTENGVKGVRIWRVKDCEDGPVTTAQHISVGLVACGARGAGKTTILRIVKLHLERFGLTVDFKDADQHVLSVAGDITDISSGRRFPRAIRKATE